MAVYTRTGDLGETGLMGGKRVSKGDWLVNVIGQVDELNSHLGLAGAMMESVKQFHSFPDGVRNPSITGDTGHGGAGKVSQFQKIEVGLASLIGQVRDVQRELFEIGSVLAGNRRTEEQKNPDGKQASNGAGGRTEEQKQIIVGETRRMAEEFVNGRKSPDHRIAESPDNRTGIPQDQKRSDVKYQVFNSERLEQLIDEMEQDLPRLENFILPGGGVLGAQLMVCRSVCRRAEREFVRYLNSKSKAQSSKLQQKSEKYEVEVLKYLNRLSDYLFVSSRWVNWLMREEETLWKRN